LKEKLQKDTFTLYRVGLCGSLGLSEKLNHHITMKTRLNPAQKAALKAYNFALAQEDRYLGSVFVTAQGQRDIEAKTQAAYQACKTLGMTHEHGL